MRHLFLPRLGVSRETLLVETGAADFTFFSVVAVLIVVEAQRWIVVRFRLRGRGLLVAHWAVRSPSLLSSSVAASEVVV